MIAIPSNRNGLALSDQGGMTVIYFLSYCAHWAEAKRRATAMHAEADPQWAYVELMALCYRDLAIAQGSQYRVECSVSARSRAWLEQLGVPAASPEQIAALRASDGENGRYSAALAATEDYFRLFAPSEETP